MAMQSRLARPFLNISRRNNAVLPVGSSPYARPEMVDMMTYEYPNNPNYYPGKGPFMLPEKWDREAKTIYYFIPRTLHEWWGTMLGESGTAVMMVVAYFALSSKEWYVWSTHTDWFFWSWFMCASYNAMVGQDLLKMLIEQHETEVDRLYAIKEHDIEAYGEIVELYKVAQEQAKGQALYNQQKLTNLALMLETEYLARQNTLVSEVTRKLNYQVAIQNALADHESAHMIKWIEGEVQKELEQLDQNEQIQACVDHLKSL